MKIDKEIDHYSIFALFLGCLGLILWVLPTVSVVINFVTLYFGRQGLESNKIEIAQASVALGVIGLILTILRSGLVLILTA